MCLQVERYRDRWDAFSYSKISAGKMKIQYEKLVARSDLNICNAAWSPFPCAQP